MLTVHNEALPVTPDGAPLYIVLITKPRFLRREVAIRLAGGRRGFTLLLLFCVEEILLALDYLGRKRFELGHPALKFAEVFSKGVSDSTLHIGSVTLADVPRQKRPLNGGVVGAAATGVRDNARSGSGLGEGVWADLITAEQLAQRCKVNAAKVLVDLLKGSRSP